MYGWTGGPAVSLSVGPSLLDTHIVDMDVVLLSLSVFLGMNLECWC
jgi:hypothetical protein